MCNFALRIVAVRLRAAQLQCVNSAGNGLPAWLVNRCSAQG